MFKGRTIAITRPRDQAEEVCDIIKREGGVPYLIPTIETKRSDNLSVVKHFIDDLTKGKVDYVIFMSVNGIKYLIESAEILGLKDKLLEYLTNVCIVAVGPKTASKLESCQIRVDLIPEKYSSQGIVESLGQLDISGKIIYLLRTNVATPNLKENLEMMKAIVREIYVYESFIPNDPYAVKKFLNDLIYGKIHAIIFGSSLSAHNLFQMLRRHLSEDELINLLNNKSTIVAIGPLTAKTLHELKVKIDIIPKKYLFEEALSALAQYWNTQKESN